MPTGSACPPARRLHPARAARVALVLGLLAGLLAPLVGDGPARADTRADQSRARSGAAAAAHDLADSSRALRAAERRLRASRAALDRARDRAAVAARRLRVARAQEQRARREVAAVVADIADHRDTVGAIARRAYQGGTLPEAAVALGADSPRDFAERIAMTEQLARSEDQALAGLAAGRAELAAAQARASAGRAARDAAHREALRAARAADRLVAQSQRAARVARVERARDLARYRAMRAQADRLARLLAARAAAARSASTLRGGAGVLARPVNGPVTSGFGMRVHPVTGQRKLHDGTDFGAACGTPVRSALAGRVISRGSVAGYGNRVVVEHGNVRGHYLATAYNHLSRFGAGGRVARGQVIGYVGSTGYSTGCHLHFMVNVDGGWVDPLRWL